MSESQLDLTLYLVTDPDIGNTRPLVDIVSQAVAGGVTCVQLRDKKAPTRKLIDQARSLVTVCRHAGVPLIVNDRVDVALAVGADGVHLGQDDMTLGDARRILGRNAIIGVSIRTQAEAVEAQAGGADYVAANGVWATPTKTDLGAPLGVDTLRNLMDACTLPMVAIGGINEKNAHRLGATGCAGIAVVSAIMGADSPTAAARLLRQRFGR